jgi:hypothetical protein
MAVSSLMGTCHSFSCYYFIFFKFIWKCSCDCFSKYFSCWNASKWFFLFFKNYFLNQHIKIIQNIKKIIFNKKKLIFLKTRIPRFQMLPLFFILLLTTHLDSDIGVEFFFLFNNPSHISNNFTLEFSHTYSMHSKSILSIFLNVFRSNLTSSTTMNLTGIYNSSFLG